MAEAAAPAKSGALSGAVKTVMGGTVGLIGGVVTMYTTAFFDQVVKPPKPLANFTTKVDGQVLSCESKSTGDSGWWDFGDGSALEPYTSDKPTISHQYTKTGSYNVKLTVRNFLADENSRTVPVEVGTAPAATGSSTSPATVAAQLPNAKLTVEPIGTSMTAPMTFRVRGQVQNAEKAFIDIVSPGVTQAGGADPNNRITVTPAGGVIDTLVVVDKPGEHAIQLFGTKGDEIVKQAAFVKVTAPTQGSVSAYLHVTDVGIKQEIRSMSSTVAIPLPAKNAPKNFEKVVNGMAGYDITNVKIENSPSKAVSNVKVEVAGDKHSFRVTGDWAGNSDAVMKLAAGTDPMIKLTLTYTRQEPVVNNTRLSVKLNGTTTGSATLPPMPTGLIKFDRTIEVGVYVYQATGERTLIAKGNLMPNQPMRQTINSANGQKFMLDVGLDPAQKQVNVMLKPN
ncbi:MAG: PKD domain-containing protein [Gemmataceae bacterium]